MQIKTTLNPIPVMCVVSKNSVAGSKPAFNKLESKLTTLKGRKFYGTLLGRPENGIYRVCVAVIPTDDLVKMDLEIWMIPGGNYVKAKIADWEKHLDQIGSVVSKLIDENGIDETRPTIEFYRSQRELILYVPIP